MNPEPHDEEQIIRYLLMRATPEERAAFEASYLTDAENLERLDAVEEELIDDYLARELSVEDARSFEETYLSDPGRRAKVEFAKALRQSLSGRRRSRWAGAGMAAVAILAVVAVSLVIWQQSGSRDEVSFVLIPGVTRALGEQRVLAIPRKATVVNLRLELDRPAQGIYRAELRTVEDTPAWHGEVSILGTTATLKLPTDRFREEDYVLIVEGVASYSFRVVLR